MIREHPGLNATSDVPRNTGNSKQTTRSSLSIEERLSWSSPHTRDSIHIASISKFPCLSFLPPLVPHNTKQFHHCVSMGFIVRRRMLWRCTTRVRGTWWEGTWKTEAEWKSSFTVVYGPAYRVLPISDVGHFLRTEYYYVLYSIAQKSFIITFIIKIFFRTQKDFEMMTKMKMKLNPQNSVSFHVWFSI